MKKRFLALALGTLAFGVTLGGVKMGLGHQDALMVKAAETEKTVIFNASSEKAADATITSLSSNGVTFSVAKGTSTTTNPCKLDDGTAYRFYQGSILTIESDDPNLIINSIKITCANKYNPENFIISAGFSTSGQIGSWSGSADSVSFNLKAQVRVTTISVTLQPSTPVTTSPIKSISAKLADPTAAFYVGDTVGLADFVITATHEDEKTSVLNSGITIENPVLVEGENIVKFHYVSGETPLVCQLVVNAIKGNFFVKTTSAADIVAGKRILIAGKNGEAVFGAQTGSSGKTYRSQMVATPKNDRILFADGFVPLLVVPAKGGFALYDETAKGVLCSVSSTDNYIGTQTNFEKIDESAFATFATSDKNGRFDIKFAGTNEKRVLSYNASAKRFSCYGSSQAETLVYVSNEDPVSFKTEAWASGFMENLEIACDPTGATALPETDWADIKSEFDALSIPDKMAIKYGASNGTEMAKALKAYDFIVNKYVTYKDFLGRRTTTRANALMLPGAADSTTWTLVGIGAVTIAASASLLFFRRKKSN